VSTKSIALSQPSFAQPTINIPALPQMPNLSSLLPNLNGGQQQANGPTTQNFGGFDLPIGTTCEALLTARQVLLAQPQTPAIQVALAINALQLALLHCEQISGD
jgi:hypothetical protein